ncbi:AsnC family transcriptional regulator [Paraoerskovia sediminicola]|uniref:AsnC family transcriptional regulator n=1 Tax=Paraoerskovia sediminicola TaxID=1138587 RepID=A0ABM8G2M6_9CELL|nr:Lrp/AsnC family transcriptional regulator [Paraoerskovia sediminicola]BDZ42295.1 AsnC family transcriptional regulator [Paraoerskovia sediminicola]
MLTLDETDRRIVAALDRDPRATVLWIARELGLARGTVHARLERLASADVLAPHSVRVRPAALGHPMRAFVTAEVDQAEFDGMIADMRQIPQVVEVAGTSGDSDLMVEIVARDADHVYDVTQQITRCRGVRRTSTRIVLRDLVARRLDQLVLPG